MGVQKQRRPKLAFTHLLLGGGCNRENAPQAQTKQKLVPFSKHNLRHCVEATRWKLIRCASPSPIIAQLNLSPLGGLDYVGVHSVRLSVGCKFRTTLPWGSCSAKSSSLWVFVFFLFCWINILPTHSEPWAHSHSLQCEGRVFRTVFCCCCCVTSHLTVSSSYMPAPIRKAP